MHIAGYWAKIAANDNFDSSWATCYCPEERYEMPEYAPVISTDGRKAICYISSEPGQEWEVQCGTDSGDWHEDVEFNLYADGRLISTGVASARPGTTYTLGDRAISATEDRVFEFADYDGKQVEEMDIDDDSQDVLDPFWRDRGRITLEMIRVRIMGYVKGIRQHSTEFPGLSTVQLGRTRLAEDDGDEVHPITENVENEPFAVFQWQHRSREFLYRHQFMTITGGHITAQPSDATILPQFEQLSLTARTVDMSELTSRLSGMGVDNSHGDGRRNPSGH